MTMGLGVVATDCDSGPTELVEHGQSGLLVPVEDVDALAEAIRTLLLDHDLRARLGEAATTRAREFSAAAIAARIEQVIAGKDRDRPVRSLSES